MSGKINVILFGLLISVTSCAKPKYENVIQKNVIVQSGELKMKDCPLRLEKSNLCIFWKWESEPINNRDGIISFKTVRPNQLDGSQLAVDPEADVSVLLWMPSMGHGSAPTKTEQVDIGSYRTREVMFVMGGVWQIRFQLHRDGKLYDEAIVEVNR